MNPYSNDWPNFLDYAKRIYKAIVEIAEEASKGDQEAKRILIQAMASPIRFLYIDWAVNSEVRNIMKGIEETPLPEEAKEIMDEIWPLKGENRDDRNGAAQTA